MQTRLKVQRTHIAAIEALPYWQEKFQDAENLIHEEECRLVTHLASLKTWCGGYKYNTEQARGMVERRVGPGDLFSNYYFFSDLQRLERRRDNGPGTILGWINKFIETTENKSGFMVILTEEQYGWIWRGI